MIEIPTTKLQGETWILLKDICDSFTVRAAKIKTQGRVKDPSGHRVDQAYAKGSVKCKPKAWNISEVKL